MKIGTIGAFAAITGLSLVLGGCSSGGGDKSPVVTPSDNAATKQANQKDEAAEGDNLGSQGQNSADAAAQDQQVTPPVDAATDQETVTPTGDPGVEEPDPAAELATKYPDYRDPTDQELNNPKNIVLYNYTSEGVTVNNAVKKVIPPGKSVVMRKKFADLNQFSMMYQVRVTTESGKTATGSFDGSKVNAEGWTASIDVNPDTGKVEIKQNAGGGDGGESFDNFE